MNVTGTDHEVEVSSRFCTHSIPAAQITAAERPIAQSGDPRVRAAGRIASAAASTLVYDFGRIHESSGASALTPAFHSTAGSGAFALQQSATAIPAATAAIPAAAAASPTAARRRSTVVVALCAHPSACPRPRLRWVAIARRA